MIKYFLWNFNFLRLSHSLDKIVNLMGATIASQNLQGNCFGIFLGTLLRMERRPATEIIRIGVHENGTGAGITFGSGYELLRIAKLHRWSRP